MLLYIFLERLLPYFLLDDRNKKILKYNWTTLANQTTTTTPATIDRKKIIAH
jgi:hypothetical protein